MGHFKKRDPCVNTWVDQGQMGTPKNHFFESLTGFLFNSRNKSKIERTIQKLLKIEICAEVSRLFKNFNNFYVQS